MHRTLSVLAWCVALAVAALGNSATSATAGERYWRHPGGYVGADFGIGCGGGTDCPTEINRYGDGYGHRFHGNRRDHWRHGEYREHRRYPRREHHRRYMGPGPGIYFDVMPAPRYYEPRPHRRAVSVGRAHVEWCYNRYRSYRASDNTFQPYNGPRQQCWSPYS